MTNTARHPPGHFFMKRKALFAVGIVSLLFTASPAQKKKALAGAKPKTIIFAVADGGKNVQPIAFIEKGKLAEIDAEGDQQAAFAKNYYKPRTKYTLVFGGGDAGTVTINKANYPGECAGNSAASTTVSSKARLGGLVMALATNAESGTAAGYRRMPTAAERTEIEKLVRAEFTRHKVAAAALKKLRYHNLTAVDVNNDGTPEFVGSYWTESTKASRDLLFFIAETSADEKLALTYSDHSNVTPDDVMSGELSDMDTGVGHELLLDVFDVDGDGEREIFTIGRAFEGDNFFVYRSEKGKWTKVYETYNYRCAY